MKWVKSYLCARQQSLVFHKVVPGPKLFNITLTACHTCAVERSKVIILADDAVMVCQ